MNAISFDVEDYFHAAALESAVSREAWSDRPTRVAANTSRLLDLLERRQVRATFFVLGWVAERDPSIVRRIAKAGHEVACHGYGHEPVHRQSPAVFRAETARAKAILESQAQCRVRGYRAATWSVVRRSLWSLDVLGECGFDYDSSIFPVHHDLYGIPDAQRSPHRLPLGSGRAIIEFPPSTVRLLGTNVPVAGGGYFRLLPLGVTRWAIRRVNAEGIPFLFYLHPWEIDPGQPRLSVGLKSRFRHYTGLSACERKLDLLLAEFPMGRVCDVLDGLEQGLAVPPAGPLAAAQTSAAVP